MNYIEVEKGVRLHLTDFGKGKPIVLIHGWPENDEIFKFHYDLLVKQGYRVIGITLRGYGLSDRTPGKYNLDTFSMDIIRVIEILELSNVSLLGFSMGGAVAAHCIANYQPAAVIKLILVAANVPYAVSQEDFKDGPSKENIDEALSAIEADRCSMVDIYGGIFQLEESFMPKTTGSWINEINLKASLEATLEGLKMLRDINLRPILNQIKIPTALFYSSVDNVVSFELAKITNAEIANSFITNFESGGHWLMFLEREKFLRELANFIR